MMESMKEKKTGVLDYVECKGLRGPAVISLAGESAGEIEKRSINGMSLFSLLIVSHACSLVEFGYSAEINF